MGNLLGILYKVSLTLATPWERLMRPTLFSSLRKRNPPKWIILGQLAFVMWSIRPSLPSWSIECGLFSADSFLPFRMHLCLIDKSWITLWSRLKRVRYGPCSFQAWLIQGIWPTWMEIHRSSIHFPSFWISLIMECITSASFKVLTNGILSEPFRPSRGILDRAPRTSSLCALMFSFQIWIRLLWTRGLECLGLLPRGPKSQSLLLRMTVTCSWRQRLDQWIGPWQSWTRASGQAINRAKSSILFSPKTSHEVKTKIRRLIGVPIANKLDQNLGLPLITGRVNRQTFHGIIDKVEESRGARRRHCCLFGNSSTWKTLSFETTSFLRRVNKASSLFSFLLVSNARPYYDLLKWRNFCIGKRKP